MKKIICTALAATMCMSVGLMAGATSVDDYEYTVGRDSGSVEKYEENNGITDTGTALRDYDGMDVQEFYFDNDEAIYGTSEIEEDKMVFPQDTETSDLDGWRPPSATTDKQVPYPRNADATTGATEIIIEDEDPMSQGTSELYAADGGIGFGTKYYNNTGLRHKKGNANKYIMTAEEWQRILDKDDVDNDTDGIGGWGRPIRMTQHGVQILNFDGSVMEEVEYSSDISITPNYVSNFWKDLWESTNLKSASTGSKMTQSSADIIKSFTVTPDGNSYLYYKDGGLWLHSAGIVPLPGVNNVPFTWACTYGEGMQAEGMVVIDASAEVDTLITNMTAADYNAVSNFTMTFSVTNYRYNFVFNMMKYDEIAMWPNGHVPNMFGSYI